MATHIGSILSGAAQRGELGRHITAAAVVEKTNGLLAAIVGGASEAWCASFRHGVVRIAAVTPAGTQAVRQHADGLLRRLQQQLPHARIVRVEVMTRPGGPQQ